MEQIEGQVSEISYRAWWDDQPGVIPGWYVEYRRGGEVIDDSEKVGHPALPIDESEEEAREIIEEHAWTLARA